jgi:hypothetical protein
MHTLYFRVMSDGGQWSVLNFASVYITDDNIGGSVLSAFEFFIDNEQGQSISGTLFTNGISNGAIGSYLSTLGISAGMHTCCLRARSNSGIWGVSKCLPIFIQQTMPGDQITEYEILIDQDDGQGNGIQFLADEVTPTVINNLLSTAGLSNGMHTICIRSKSETMQWSASSCNPIYVQPNTQGTPTEIISGEYFTDADPGVGNGTSFTVLANDSIEVSEIAAIANLPIGIHSLTIRMKSSLNQWSTSRSSVFFVTSSNDPSVAISEIDGAEYFIGADPGTGEGTPIEVSTAQNVLLEGEASLLGLPLGITSISLRFHSTNNIWSDTEIIPITICETFGPLASFDADVFGNNVFFSSTSLYADSVSWHFPDGFVTDSPFPSRILTNDSHIIQLEAFNGCGSSTFTDTIHVQTISSYFPDKGSNQGSITIHVQGAGYADGSTFWLEKDGIQIYADSTIAIFDGYDMHGIFNLIGTETGLYDIHVQVPQSGEQVLTDAFEIIDEIQGSLTQTIIGPPMLRANWWREFKLVISNTSYNDVGGVPFLIILPSYADVQILFDVDSMPNGIMPLEEINWDDFMVIDSIGDFQTNIKVFAGICPYLPGKSLVEYKFKVKMNVPGAFRVTGHIMSAAFGPEIPVDNREMSSSSNSVFSEDCSDYFNGVVKDVALDISNAALEAIIGPVYECIGGGTLFFYQLFSDLSEMYDEQNGTIPAVLSKTLSLVSGGNKFMLDCVIAAATLAAGPEKLMIQGVLKAAGYMEDINNLTTAFDLGYDAGANSECFPELINYLQGISGTVLNAADPNEIVGPTEYLQYTNEMAMPYTIFFENVDTALVSALEIHVSDTLDASKYNFGSFQLGAMQLGDHTMNIPPGLKQFAKDEILSDSIMVRITAQFDTLTGIVNWSFLGLDPTTFDYPESLTLGILPPNVNQPEGEGFVSFSIQRLETLSDGEDITNKASIIFDTNAPIITNTWLNTLDLVSPESQFITQTGTIGDTTFVLHWQGSDNLSGVHSYDIYYSINGDEFMLLASNYAADSAEMTGQFGDLYAFYIVANDNVGNVEVKEAIAELEIYLYPENIFIQSEVSQPTCSNNNDGIIQLDVIGGSGTYSYLWNGIEGTNTLENLGPGSYVVQVSDELGNVEVLTVELTPQFVLDITVQSTPFTINFYSG